MSLPIIVVSQSDQAKKQFVGDFLASFQVALEHPDVWYVSEKMGIEAIKKIREHLLFKSTLSSKKFVIIDPADNLTVDAQNGLLKILEEPSEQTEILLMVNQVDNLITTIRSRCEIKYLLISETLPDNNAQIPELLSKDIADRLEMIEKIEDKKQLLIDLLRFYHQNLNSSAKDLSSIKALLTAEIWVKHNVAAKAVLDYIMIVLPMAKNTND